MVGQEYQYVARTLADSLDTAQQMRALLLCARTAQADDLILEDATVLRRLAFLDHLGLSIVLHAGDEEHASPRPFGEQPVIVVAQVINHNGAEREGYSPGGLDVGDTAISNQTEARQVAVVVEHQVQLDRTLGAAEPRPIVHGQAQVNDVRVEADQLVLDAELLFAHGFGCHDVEQAVEDLLEQLSGAMSIDVGQRRAGRGFDAQMGQLALAALQPTFDFPQRVGAAQLVKQHTYKLAPARQALAPVLRPPFP